ncbi:MAG: dephospho-CoA kinase [Ferruginibacter sp.]
MLRIGLTGGIGSGKTTVAKIFEVLSVPVYYADDAAKRIMNEDEDLKQQIIEHFGLDAYINGQLNRSHLSAIVFDNPEKLTLLNSLVHPVTIADADKWMQQQTTQYIIKEAALMFETEAYKHVDYVIGVSAPEELRIHRTTRRDNTTEAAVAARMNKQMDETKKLERCDFIINNDETILLIPQVLQLHQKFSFLLQKK